MTKKVTKKLSIVHASSAPDLSYTDDVGGKRKFSSNPFGGPVATNPFNSPFADKKGENEAGEVARARTSSASSVNSSGKFERRKGIF